MKGNGKKKRIWLRVLVGLAAGFTVIVGGFLAFVLLGKDTTMALAPKTVPLENLADGVYHGNYSGFRWSNTVEVTVKDHRITGISVVKPQVFIKPETADELTKRVKEAQSPDVDVVTGATVDSKGFLQAVENALESKAGND